MYVMQNPKGRVMDDHNFLLHLMAILLGARICGELAARLKAPSVIGELFAGVIMGPSLLGLVTPGDTIKALAEIGIILLLFEVGLETAISQLARSGRTALLVALVGVVAPFALGFLPSYYLFDLPLIPSLFIGGTLTATSIGITVRVLSDLKRQKSPEAQVVLGAAVLDDVIGVVLLAVLYDFVQGGTVDPLRVGRIMGFIAVFMLVAPFAAKLLSRTIQRVEKTSEIPGLIPSSIVALLLFSAWAAHGMGAPELLGGFTAGLALSRYFAMPFAASLGADAGFAHRVEEQTRPIVHLFSPIFFVMVGLSLNLREVDWSSSYVWLLSSTLLVAATAGKLGSGLLMRHLSPAARWAVGLSMVPRGEVGLIFAELGRTSGIFNQDTYAALLIVIALTTVAPPFLLRWFYNGPGRNLPAEA